MPTLLPLRRQPAPHPAHTQHVRRPRQRLADALHGGLRRCQARWASRAPPAGTARRGLRRPSVRRTRQQAELGQRSRARRSAPARRETALVSPVGRSLGDAPLAATQHLGRSTRGEPERRRAAPLDQAIQSALLRRLAAACSRRLGSRTDDRPRRRPVSCASSCRPRSGPAGQLRLRLVCPLSCLLVWAPRTCTSRRGHRTRTQIGASSF